MRSMPPYRRLSSSLSSCLDSVEALIEPNVNIEEEDGGGEGAIFLVGNHVGDKGVERIVDGLQDPCRVYYKLYLCDNRIGQLGGSFISCALKYNTTLTELSLGGNSIGDEGAKHLASALKENNTLLMINLERNHIGHTGVTALANALEHENHSLKYLVLSENPIEDFGAKALLNCVGNTSSFDHLQQCNHNLQSIVLRKVTQIKDISTLRKIQCYVKINRLMAEGSARLAAQRKILYHVKENTHTLMDYFSIIQRNDSEKEMYCMAKLLALLGNQKDVSTIFAVLKSSPPLLSSDPEIRRVRCVVSAFKGD